VDEVDILLECHVYAQAMDSTLTTVTLDTFLLHQAVVHTNSIGMETTFRPYLKRLMIAAEIMG